MANPSFAVPLPPSIEQMLQKICTEQSKPPPDTTARQKLASLGEEASLHILRKIAATEIRYSFSGFIMHMAGRDAYPESPQKSVRLSPQNRSPVVSFSPNYRRGRDDAASNSPVPENMIGSPSSSWERTSRQSSSPQLEALGQLEFRKAFLILSYIGGNHLEHVISADEIQRLKDLRMDLFESKVWNALGQNYINGEDRRKSLDWDSGKTYLYHCHVAPDGSYTFKGPYLHKTRTRLQRVLGDDNVLNVKFSEEVKDGSCSVIGSSDAYSGYNKIAKEGILVGLRRYHFFLFKDGGKEAKKKNPTTSPVQCFFVRMDPNASSDNDETYILYKKTVHEARCLFMHIHKVSSVAKYVARFALILSKTIKLEVDLASVHIERIEDKPCRDKDGNVVKNEDGEPLIHTDGTGFISEDLALKCPKNLYKGNTTSTAKFEKFLGNVGLEESVSELRRSESHAWDPPLLIQIRLFNNGCAVKGTLLVNRKLPLRTIQIRPSMIKVETDSSLSNIQTDNSLELVGTSNQPRKTYLSRYLIALLSYGGVPKGYFMHILLNALEDLQCVYTSKLAALKVSLNYGEMDDFTVAMMILSGIPLDEPFLRYRLSILMKEERKGLKGGKIPISDCYYLMGTADPSGLLNSDEVCIILDNGPISGKVLVYKHPGLHFGDIHILNATYVDTMKDFVGNAKYAIFFPTIGCRSLADEMANSDFDGDMYFVSRNSLLLEHFKASDPWNRTCSKQNVLNKKPSEFSAEDLEHEIFQRFLTTRFQPCRTIGTAADSWLVFMDRLLVLGNDSVDEKDCVKKKMLHLTDMYYDALDASKTGMKIEVPDILKPKKYPHFMERDNSYKSASILGQIYDAVESFQMEIRPINDVWSLPCFDVQVPDCCLVSWKNHYDTYRNEMAAALRNAKEIKDDSPDEVIKKYKEILYGGANFEARTRKEEEIFNDALAIYKVSYGYAESQGQVSYCNFPWRVAGSALCRLYAIKQGEKSIICVPSVLREMLNKPRVR